MTMYPIAFGATNVRRPGLLAPACSEPPRRRRFDSVFVPLVPAKLRSFCQGQPYGEPDPHEHALSRNGTRHPHVRKLAG